MNQEEINENKSFVAFYFAKFNENAREALGFRTFTAAFKSCSVSLGGPDNAYLKQRRDEFDVYFEWRKGYDRPPTAIVQSYYDRWNNIEFEDFTRQVRELLHM